MFGLMSVKAHRQIVEAQSQLIDAAHGRERDARRKLAHATAELATLRSSKARQVANLTAANAKRKAKAQAKREGVSA